MSALLTIISVLATSASVGLLASPIVTVRQLEKAKSIGVLTITFFCAQLMNCVVWSMYGIQQGALPVIICNALGTSIATYCILVFLSVAKVEEKSGHPLQSTTLRQCYQTALGVAALAVIFLFLILILYNTVGYAVSSQLNGVCGGCCSVIMLSSPLGMAKTIIKNKNAQGLQPLVMAFGTANSILWSLYGILVGDWYIITPNVLCAVACFFQFYLLLRYGRRPVEAVEVKASIADVPI